MNKRICLALIVQDEEQWIVDCLKSVHGFVEKVVVIDFGSQDQTIELVKESVSSRQLVLRTKRWQGFSAARNLAFSTARRHADYVLMMDADERLESTTTESVEKLVKPVYFIETWLGATRFYRPALLDSSKDWKFHGSLHEWPYLDAKAATAHSDQNYLVDAVLRNVRPPNSVNRKARDDRDLLMQDLAHPLRNCDAQFHLAELEFNTARYQDAIALFNTSLDKLSSPYHRFRSHLYIGMAYEKLSDFVEAYKAYQRAFDEAPERAEALYRLIRLHRLQRDYKSAVALGQVALDMSPPISIYPVDFSIYESFIPSEVASALHALKRYQEAADLYKRVLSTRVAPPELLENVRLALTSLEQTN